MTTCCKCKKEKETNEFNYKKRSLDLRSRSCKECSREAVRNHYLANKKYYLNKAHRRNERIVTENQAFLLEYLSQHSCVDCGENDPVVLEFDHIRNKSENVSEMIGLKYSKQKLIEEIEKCEIRCANCHRRKTAKDHHWYKYKNAPVA